MSFYDEDFNRSRRRPSGFFSYFLVALLGALIGSAIMGTILIPQFLAQQEEGNENDFELNIEEYFSQERELVIPGYQDTSVVRAAKHVTPAVVGISNRGKVYDFFQGSNVIEERATGSGVIISPDGYVITNYHVIEEASELVIVLGDGTEVEAEVVGVDPATDLAVLKIEAEEDFSYVSIGSSDDLQVGETAIAIGNPLGLSFQQTVTVGVISAVNREIDINEYRFTFTQTDAAINDGNSGGPLVNLQGEVIGINTAKIKIPGVEGMGFAIPADTVKEITEELIERGRVTRPWIGVQISEVSAGLAERFNLPVEEGVIIEDIVTNSPAHRDGLQVEDIIVGLAGEQVRTFIDLRNILFKQKVGDEVEVNIFRGNEKMSIPITLQEMPEDVG